MESREYLARKLYSAHVRMEAVYSAITAGECQLGNGAYSSAVRRLHSAEQLAWDSGYSPASLIRWNSELQAWRVIS